jgi:hypothetical protein
MWPRLLRSAVSSARMAPYLPPEIQASSVESGRVMCAKPERKITHLIVSFQLVVHKVGTMCRALK